MIFDILPVVSHINSIWKGGALQPVILGYVNRLNNVQQLNVFFFSCCSQTEHLFPHHTVGVTEGAGSSSVCVVLSPPVVGCSLLPARQLRLLQVCELQSSARRAPPAVEARGVLLHPLRAAGSGVHRRGGISASSNPVIDTTAEHADVAKQRMNGYHPFSVHR